jgi:cell shape-determining protein MreC
MTMEIKGRDLVAGVPKTLIMNSDEVREALAEPVNQIVDAVRSVLERTPPELAADIVDRGIVLTGGGSQLATSTCMLREETGLPVMVSDSPECAVVLGTGRALDELALLAGSRAAVAGARASCGRMTGVASGSERRGGGGDAVRRRRRAAHERAEPGELSALDRGILRLVSPGQAAMSYVARGITGVAGRYVELKGVRAENESLHRENRQLRTELMEMRRLAEESGRYQRLLGLRDATPAETIAARVIAVDASPYFRVARVDIDRGEGTVRRGMPVLTPEGVVGRVNRVAGKTSDVLLLVDPRSALDVIVPRTGGRGILRGKSGENGYRCSIEYLQRGQVAQVGDKVVTSGLGGAFPRDLPGRAHHRGHAERRRPLPGGRGHARRRLRRLSEVLVVAAPPPRARSRTPATSAAPPPPPAAPWCTDEEARLPSSSRT